MPATASVDPIVPALSPGGCCYSHFRLPPSPPPSSYGNTGHKPNCAIIDLWCHHGNKYYVDIMEAFIRGWCHGGTMAVPWYYHLTSMQYSLG